MCQLLCNCSCLRSSLCACCVMSCYLPMLCHRIHRTLPCAMRHAHPPRNPLSPPAPPGSKTSLKLPTAAYLSSLLFISHANFVFSPASSPLGPHPFLPSYFLSFPIYSSFISTLLSSSFLPLLFPLPFLFPPPPPQPCGSSVPCHIRYIGTLNGLNWLLASCEGARF